MKVNHAGLAGHEEDGFILCVMQSGLYFAQPTVAAGYREEGGKWGGQCGGGVREAVPGTPGETMAVELSGHRADAGNLGW